MEYKTYLARKRLKKLVICGHVNIPYGTAVTNEGGVLMERKTGLRHYQPRCL